MSGTIPFSGLLSTTATSDTYAVTDPLTGIDGLRSVANKTARNAITTERRRAGMLVFTQDTNQYWSLNAPAASAPFWAGTDADWTLLALGSGGSSVTEQEFLFTTPSQTWTCDHSLGGSPQVTVIDSNGYELAIQDIHYVSNTQVVIHHETAGGETGRAILRK